MTIIRNQDYEQFSQIEDERIRESFRVLYDNTAALQEQVEQLKGKIVAATDLADLQTEVSTLFDGSASSNATSTTLPIATSSTLGGVKDGAGVTIAVDGTLSVDSHTHTHDHSGVYLESLPSHTHNYQPVGNYAISNHNHAGVYLEILPSHNHNYQPVGNYANSVHSHDYAASGHSHSGYVADTNTYWKNAIQSYGNGSTYHSELPYRQSQQAAGSIFTFVGNSTGSEMMIYKNGSYYRWVGTSHTAAQITERFAELSSFSYSWHSTYPFSNNTRPSRLYLRNDNNASQVGLIQCNSHNTSIKLVLHFYSLSSSSSTSPSYYHQGSTTIATV